MHVRPRNRERNTSEASVLAPACQRTGGSDRDFAFAKGPRNVRISQLPQPPDGPNCGSSAKAEVLSKLLRIQDWFLWDVRELRVSWWRLQQLPNLPKSFGQLITQPSAQDSRRVLHVCASHSCDHNVSNVWKQSMLVLHTHRLKKKRSVHRPTDNVSEALEQLTLMDWVSWRTVQEDARQQHTEPISATTSPASCLSASHRADATVRPSFPNNLAHLPM